MNATQVSAISTLQAPTTSPDLERDAAAMVDAILAYRQAVRDVRTYTFMAALDGSLDDRVAAMIVANTVRAQQNMLRAIFAVNGDMANTAPEDQVGAYIDGVRAVISAQE